MDNNSNFTQEPNQPNRSGKFAQKLLIGLGVFALILVIGGGIYLGQGPLYKGQLADEGEPPHPSAEEGICAPNTYYVLPEGMDSETLFDPANCQPIDYNNCDLINELWANHFQYYIDPNTWESVESQHEVCTSGNDTPITEEGICAPNTYYVLPEGMDSETLFDPANCQPIDYNNCDLINELWANHFQYYIDPNTWESVESQHEVCTSGNDTPITDEGICTPNTYYVLPEGMDPETLFDPAYCQPIDYENCELINELWANHTQYNLHPDTSETVASIHENQQCVDEGSQEFEEVSTCPPATYYVLPEGMDPETLFDPAHCQPIDYEDCDLVNVLWANHLQYYIEPNTWESVESTHETQGECTEENPSVPVETSNNPGSSGSSSTSSSSSGSSSGFTPLPSPQPAPNPNHAAATESESVTLEEASPYCGIYRDILSDDGDCEAMKYLYKEGIMTGKPGNLFDPEGNLLRSDAAKIITAKGFDASLDYCKNQTLYKDISLNDWFAQIVCDGTKRGVITGYIGELDQDYQKFRPEKPLNNAEFSALVVRNFLKQEVLAYSKSPSFTDVDVDAWYAVFAKVFKKNGLTSGEYFFPDKNITRREVARVLYLILQVQP